MTIKELSQELKEKYENADRTEKLAQIHLFGIKHGKAIRTYGFSVSEIVKGSKIKDSYIAEVNKGIKLSQHVSLKEFKVISMEELVDILKDKYFNSNKDAVAQIHLFGIKYGKQIKMNNYRIADIIELAGISDTYVTELNKGIKLGEFVK